MCSAVTVRSRVTYTYTQDHRSDHAIMRSGAGDLTVGNGEKTVV